GYDRRPRMEFSLAALGEPLDLLVVLEDRVAPQRDEGLARDVERETLKAAGLRRRLMVELQVARQEIDLRGDVHRAAILVCHQLSHARDDQRRERANQDAGRRFLLLLRMSGRPSQRAENRQARRPLHQNVTRKEKNVGLSTCRSEPVRNARARSKPSEPGSTPGPTVGPLNPSGTNAYPPPS